MDNFLINIESEQAVLGVLLLDNNAFVHCAQLQVRHFAEPVHQRIFEAIARQWEGGKHFSPVTLKAQFDHDPALVDIGGAVYLNKLAASSVFVIRISEHVEIIIDFYQRRELHDVCTAANAAISSSTERSPVEIAADFSVRIQDAVAGFEKSVFQDDYEVAESILDSYKRNLKPIKTGYEMLDIAMAGGVYPGKSYGFAARKKLGKTILAGTISHNLNQSGVKHLFICGEMSPEEIQKRTIARVLRVEPTYLNRDNPEGELTERDKEMMRRVSLMARETKRNVIYKNAPGLTFEDLKRYVLLARMQKKITGFILDYWQLVGGKPKGKSTAEHLDEVAQWIADTCRKYGLWSITMAQINQEGNTRGGEGIRLAFDQVYTLCAPNDDPGRSDRWLEMADTRYTAWRSVGSANRPGFYLNQYGPYFSETPDGEGALDL